MADLNNIDDWEQGNRK